MFRFLILVLALFFVFSCAINDGGDKNTTTTTTTTTTIAFVSENIKIDENFVNFFKENNLNLKETGRTIFVYFAGDNNLTPIMESMLLDLKGAGTPTETRYIILFDKKGEDSLHIIDDSTTDSFYYLKEELNISSPSTLVSFIKWGLKNSMSHTYDLFLVDHGAGIWRSVNFFTGDNNKSRVLNDESEGENTLNAVELEKSLEYISNNSTFDKFGIISVFTCLGGAFEIFYGVSPYCRYFIGSETLLAYKKIEGTNRYISGFGFDEIAKWIKSNPKFDSLSLGKTIIDSIETDQKDVLKIIQNDLSDKIFSLFSCDYAEELTVSLNNLGEEIIKVTDRATLYQLMNIRDKTDFPPIENSQADLGHYLELLSNNIYISEKIKYWASVVKNNLSKSIIYKKEVLVGKNKMKELNGLSIFYPYSENLYNGTDIHYKDLRIARDNLGWAKMILDPPYAEDEYEDDNTIENAKLHTELAKKYYHNLYKDCDWICYDLNPDKYCVTLNCSNDFNEVELYDSDRNLIKPYDDYYYTKYYEINKSGRYYISIKDNPEKGYAYSKNSFYTIEIWKTAWAQI